jgi:hypothetical protein
MPSLSLQRWFAERAVALDNIESAHRSVRGSGPGARAATLQINQAYTVLLSGQFQGFCRDLHSECADLFVLPVADPDLRDMLRDNLTFGRKIDRGNPNPGNLGSDFERFNLSFWTLVEAHRPQNLARKVALVEMNDWRNAIAHHDFTAAMLKAGRPQLTWAQVQAWRKACDGLARSFDDVLRNHLQTLTGAVPW